MGYFRGEGQRRSTASIAERDRRSMTTRSGQRYKESTMDRRGETLGSGTGGVAGPTVGGGEGGAEGGGMVEIFRLLQAQQEQQQRWMQAQHEEERRRREDHQRRLEEEQRGQEEQRQVVQLQMEALRSMLERNPTPSGDVSTGGTTCRSGDPAEHIKLTRLTEADDVEAYLTTFERLMELGRVAEESWTLRLAPQLTGKAQQAYAALSVTDATDYRQVKGAILRRYDISEETYRQRFRNERRKVGEAYRELAARLHELAARLHDLARKWMAGCDTVDAVLEKLVVEQLASTMPTDLRIWVAERKPANRAEAGRLADDYAQARRHIRQDKPDGEDKSSNGTVDVRKCHKCGAEGHFQRNCPVKDGPGVDVSGNKEPRLFKKPEKTVNCYNCGKNGHISMNCPDKASYFCKDGWGRSVARVGRVEGTAVSDILLDTGCTCTMVRADLVPEENLLPGEAATVLCAHGDTVLYPLARVRIDVEGVDMEVRAAVSESLPVSVLLGTDVPELGRLLHSNPLVVHTNGMDHALVTTRAQSKRDSENRAEQERRQVGSGVRPRVLAVEETKPQGEETGEPGVGGSGLAEVTGRGEGVVEQGDGWEGRNLVEGRSGSEQGEEDGSVEAQGDGWEGGNLGSTFAEDLFSQTVERKKLSRRQNREERRAHGLERAKDRPSRGMQPQGEGLEVTVEELKRLQEIEEGLA